MIYILYMFHLLRLSNMHVVVPFRFASHRLFLRMQMTLHVLRLSNIIVVVPLVFASHTLPRAMRWTFKVLGLSKDFRTGCHFVM